jgi:hypothetical protein
MLLHFIVICNILQPVGILSGHLIDFTVVWYVFPRFGMLHQEKSGNPVPCALSTLQKSF